VLSDYKSLYSEASGLQIRWNWFKNTAIPYWLLIKPKQLTTGFAKNNAIKA
jgi:hypothetical protein